MLTLRYLLEKIHFGKRVVTRGEVMYYCNCVASRDQIRCNCAE